MASAVNRLAAAVGALAAIISTIWAAAESSPLLRGVIYSGAALATTSTVAQVHLTKRAAHRANEAEAHAVAAVAVQRTAEAQHDDPNAKGTP